MAGPFDAYLEQKKQQEAALTASRVRAVPDQPDQVAQGLATARELGVAPGQVMAFQEHFTDLLQQKRATTALTGAPRLSDWLTRDPVNGALAKDDLENLSWWEKTATFTGNALSRGVRRAGLAYNQAQAGFAARRAQDSNRSLGEIIYDERAPVMVDGKEVSREWAGPGDLVSSLYRYSASRVGDLLGDDEQAAVQFQMQAAQVSDAINAIPMSPGAAQARDSLGKIDATGSIGEQLRGFAQVVAQDPAGFTSFLGQVAAESLPGLAISSAVGIATRNPTAAATALGLTSGVQEYGTGQLEVLQGSGHDLTTPEGALAAISDEGLMRRAAERGEIRGIIIGAMDGLSGGLAGRALARSQVGNLIVQGFAQAIMGGGGEAAAQLATDGRINVSEVLVEALAEFVTAPAEVAGIGGRAVFSEVRRAARAGKTGTALDEASQQAQASKLRERSPETFKAALDQAGQGDNVVYVPAAGLREFFQARDITFGAETAEAWGIDVNTMAQMEISGGRVAVPMSNFASYVAGTDAEAWVRENATMDPDELSLAEAAAFNSAVQEQMDRVFEEQQAAMRAELDSRGSEQQVFDGFYSQLRGAGRSTDVAEKEARVFGAFFRSMSERVGEDALDLARRYGLRIQGPDAPGVPRRRGALDVLLNDLRAGRPEQTGRSLTQFVIDQGGVQDTGGDVAALEGPRGLVAETRDQVLARQAQPSMDGMPSTGRGLHLDELGRQAVEAGYFPELIGEMQGLNDGEAADLGRALLDALADEASGRPRYLEGEGPDPTRAVLNEALQERGLDPGVLTNDEIAVSLENAVKEVTNSDGEVVAVPAAPAPNSDAFSQWFGNSRVVDADGGPLIVYHASRAEMTGDFAFELGRSGGVDPNPSNAFYFSTNGELRSMLRDEAFVDMRNLERYTRNEGEFYLSAEKPLDMTSASARAEVQAAFIEMAKAIEAATSDRDSLRAQMQAANKSEFGAGNKFKSDLRAAEDRLAELKAAPFGAYALAGTSRGVDWTREHTWTMVQESKLQNKNLLQGDLVRWARAQGYDAVKFFDGGKVGGREVKSVAWAVMEPTQIKSITNRGTFDPADPRILYQDGQTRRGSIQFPRTGIGGGETVINLFETADLTTVIHESGHYFLEALADLAATPDAPQQLREDMAAVREFIGATEGQEIGTESHETFARALEAYFMEGKAPSLALADVFARAKAWLLRVYRSIAGLNVELTPQVREVFDRMLATDAEIAAARAEVSADPLFREKPAGMSDADWSTYQRMARRSSDEAEARLRDKTLAKVRREKEAWWKAERKELRADVEARMNTEPRFRLVEAMANGRILTAEGEQIAPDVRIDRGLLVEQFGDGVLTEMSRTRLGGKRAIYGEDGMSPAEAAEAFGFAGPVEMVETLQNTGKRLDEIAAEVDRIMLDRYGDPLNDGTVEAEAMQAIHNEQMQQKHVAEARHIAAQLGRDTRGMTATLYRQRARMMLGRMTVREAAAPARFLAAERRAGRDAQQAFAKVARGDAQALGLAMQAKEQQILNAALYDLSRQAEAEIARAREKAQDYGKKTVRAKLEGGYIEQIDDLLDRYDFRKRGPGAVAKTERMREFMDRMIADGREAELMIDPRMMDDARRIHYSRLSLEEFRGLMDTVANLDHLGRFKQNLINGQKRRELQRTAESVADAVAKNLGVGRAKQESKLRYALDLVLTADTMMIDIDGGDEFGSAYQAIKEDIDAAYVRVDEMNRVLAQDLDKLFSVYSAKDMRDMKKERAIPGTRFVWSKWQAISVALNTGNDDNMSRLLADNAHPSQRMTREDLDAVVATLDKRDWDFVQSMWDQINSFWPEIEAVTQRRTGVKPGKVEPRQVTTPFGVYKGGYYPIKYDPGLGARAAVDAATANDTFMSAGRFAKAQTKSGHSKERMKTGNGRTVMLDMGVAFSHMRDVVRDIALSEAVDNAHRVLNHNEVAQAFIEAGRKNDHDVLNLWLKDVAQGPIVHTDAINTAARFIKTNFTLSRLALNLKTVLLQATGVAQSAAVVGRRPMARAYGDYLKRPAESAAEVMAASEFMRRRQTTFDKDIQDFASDTLDTTPMRGRLSRGLEGAARFGFAPMVKVQFYSVDVPTWMAGYRNGLRRFDGDTERAVAFADRMVARAQDSGAMPDRTAVSRGTVAENARQVEWIRLFTTLQGYMMAKFNRGYVAARQGVRDVRQAETVAQKFGASADMAANLMMLYVAEGAMMGLLYAAMAAGDDEDDDLGVEKFATWMAGETFGTVIGGFPLVRDAWSGFSDFGDTGGVLGSALVIPANLYKQVVQGENDRALRRAVGDAVGMATGLPTVATLRPIEELLDEDGGSLFGALMGFNPLADD